MGNRASRSANYDPTFTTDVKLRLIRIIRCDGSLWDTRSDAYQDTAARQAQWHGIALTLKLGMGPTAQLMWAKLRDDYLRSRRQGKRSTAIAYHEELSFLDVLV